MPRKYTPSSQPQAATFNLHLFLTTQIGEKTADRLSFPCQVPTFDARGQQRKPLMLRLAALLQAKSLVRDWVRDGSPRGKLPSHFWGWVEDEQGEVLVARSDSGIYQALIVARQGVVTGEMGAAIALPQSEPSLGLETLEANYAA